MLLKREKIAGGECGLWKMTESLQALEAQVDWRGVAAYERMCEKRKREVLTVRLLLREMVGEVCLAYDDNGHPVLVGDERRISVSHTNGYVAVMVHGNRRVGVDIEYASERAYKVRERFLSEEEQCVLGEVTHDRCTIAWCAKEATYKMLPVGTDMLEGIVIDEMKADRVRTRVVETGEQFDLQYVQNDNYTLVIGVA